MMKTTLPSPKVFCISVTGLFVLAACESASFKPGLKPSAADYTAVYAEKGYDLATALDEAVRRKAPAEPLLTFPARFGIARTDGYRLTEIPEEELAIWQKVFGELDPSLYGTVEPVNLMLSRIAVEETGNTAFVNSAIAGTRLGAASQRLDAVLVYEVSSTADIARNYLALGDLTLVGNYVLQSREVETRGQINAALVNVRNGYPYFTVRQVIDAKQRTVSAGVWNRREEMEAEAVHDAVSALSADIMQKIAELAENQSPNSF